MLVYLKHCFWKCFEISYELFIYWSQISTWEYTHTCANCNRLYFLLSIKSLLDGICSQSNANNLMAHVLVLPSKLSFLVFLLANNELHDEIWFISCFAVSNRMNFWYITSDREFWFCRRGFHSFWISFYPNFIFLIVFALFFVLFYF